MRSHLNFFTTVRFLSVSLVSCPTSVVQGNSSSPGHVSLFVLLSFSLVFLLSGSFGGVRHPPWPPDVSLFPRTSRRTPLDQSPPGPDTDQEETSGSGTVCHPWVVHNRTLYGLVPIQTFFVFSRRVRVGLLFKFRVWKWVAGGWTQNLRR